ncbi:tripartite tricarboxylate transporter TctB family protein [Acuticoccus sp.]|uniref:tripartite tricarboxylate transporter TctB family protein n=1 Tax=Acuticoccus sp. TaxID=1904378 RepID=UPI003B52701D
MVRGSAGSASAVNRFSVELLVACALAALCVAGLFEAWSYRAASKYTPVAVMGLALILSLVWMAQNAIPLVRGRFQELHVERGEVARFVGVVLAVATYVTGVVQIGFFTSTLVMVPLLSAAVGYRSWPIALAATVGFVAVLYGVFRLLLSIPLPPEAVLGLVGG